ncbi:Exostosin-1 [Halotydeus destructor]|nr:Exostosin-1 [Halotydeus destructor]
MYTMNRFMCCAIFPCLWLGCQSAGYGNGPSYGSSGASDPGTPCAPSSPSSPCGHVANPYSYSYTAKVGHYEDGLIAAEESGDGNGSVKGSYSLMDPDGRMRMVSYVADAMGYRATVKTNEPGTANEDPANVDMQSTYVAPDAGPNGDDCAQPEPETPYTAAPEPTAPMVQPYAHAYMRRAGKKVPAKQPWKPAHMPPLMKIHMRRYEARKCYLLVTTCVAFLTAVYLCSPAILSLWHPKKPNVSHDSNKLPLKRRASYLESHEIDISPPFLENDHKYHRRGAIWKPVKGTKAFASGFQGKSQVEFAANCRLSNCFNISKCQPGDRLRIHIYPKKEDEPSLVVSKTYQKILNTIRRSIYYEDDPDKACVFVTRYDTLDRDPLSPDFQKSIPKFLPKDNGMNHLVFNLYSGSWPDYSELDFAGFNPGYAMLVKASSSVANYRPGFDISLPLFSNTDITRFSIINDEASLDEKKSLLVFKGKRYIYGIGSETRNSLHHLHNGRDILMYTTCKHGKKWQKLRDDRCEKDNVEYEKVDYLALMSNSTFCLAPRGRRLGSFRFLEALSLGCIPVTMSNDWVKPFNDLIDWSSVSVDGDERLVLQLPDILRSFDGRKLRRMKSQSLAIYDNYFSSVERIVLTTIAILSERIQGHI